MTKNEKEKTTDYDFSFKDVEQQVDQFLEDKGKKQKKEIETHHISDKIKQGLKIKQHLPEKNFLNVKAEEVEVQTKRTDEEGNEIIDKERKVQITHTNKDGKTFTEIVKGIFEIDLNNDAYWWFIRTPTVMPQLIDQSVRTHIDIKNAHKPEKRKIEIPYLLIIAFAIGALIIVISLISMFMG